MIETQDRLKMKNERHRMKINDIHIKMFRAGSGDCILLEFEKEDFSLCITDFSGPIRLFQITIFISQST